MSVRVPIHKYGEPVGHMLVSPEDAERVSAVRWCLNNGGRPVGYVNEFGGVTMIHRYVMGLRPGAGGFVHHHNGDLLDNRRENLRVYGTQLEHMQVGHGTQSFERRASRLARAVAVAARLEVAATRHDAVRYGRGCRCDECRAANAARMRRLKGRTPPQHGNSGYNNYGCRCEVCRAENSAYQREYRERRQAA